MKKILAALIAVVMVVSCMSVAFAASINSYDMEDKNGDGSRWSAKIAGEVKTGDKITFWVKPATIENADMYARDGAKAHYLDAEGNDTGKEVYSGKHITDNALAEVDGWYYIECVAMSDSTGYELSVDCGNVAGGTMTGAQIAGVKVNGVEVALNAYNSGEALTATAMEEPVVVEETPVETEDAPVEETGVVSIAVVAVAAVIGGAVVLKKREF
ncbi:MAG: hypothetical protein IKV30_00455 [Clostridia bacterium]|nr:hypothetical protein [Clostridia bacterium]